LKIFNPYAQYPEKVAAKGSLIYLKGGFYTCYLLIRLNKMKIPIQASYLSGWFNLAD